MVANVAAQYHIEAIFLPLINEENDTLCSVFISNTCMLYTQGLYVAL
jgi:hypothetical protein